MVGKVAFWVIVGLIVADVITHPEGTKAAGGTLMGLAKTGAQGLTGQHVG